MAHADIQLSRHDSWHAESRPIEKLLGVPAVPWMNGSGKTEWEEWLENQPPSPHAGIGLT